MFLKLDEIEKKYNELNKKICEINPSSQLDLHKSMMKEIKKLSPIVEKYQEYKSILDEINETREFFNDEDLKELAKNELENLNTKKDEILNDLKDMLSPKDPDDDRNVIIEIRAGAGGTEASLFASTLFKMYSMFAMNVTISSGLQINQWCDRSQLRPA